MTTSLPSEVQLRRLLWRATHRGIKEMDLLMGGYAKAHLADLDEQRLSEFETLLDLPDQDLLAWAMGTAEIPRKHESPLLRAILAFRPKAPV